MEIDTRNFRIVNLKKVKITKILKGSIIKNDFILLDDSECYYYEDDSFKKHKFNLINNHKKILNEYIDTINKNENIKNNDIYQAHKEEIIYIIYNARKETKNLLKKIDELVSEEDLEEDLEEDSESEINQSSDDEESEKSIIV
jgi:hypothetical protein